MTSVPPSDLISWLRAVGEPSRLRLLALCTEGALSVSELAQTLHQSEPRVSRHLKILCEAGLLRRMRQGQWVHYRLADEPQACGFVRQLLLQLDRRDPVLVRDRSEARAAAAPEHAGVPADSASRLDRAMRAFVEAGGGGFAGSSVLMVGAAHLEPLAGAASSARACAVIAESRRAAQAARAFAERRGFTCRVLAAARPGDLSERDFARAGDGFDAVLLTHQAVGEATVARLLALISRVVIPAGRLWIFQRYDSLESSRERVVEHPLARLRRLLDGAGLVCERLSPVEADGEHMIAAAARPANAAAAALSSASGR